MAEKIKKMASEIVSKIKKSARELLTLDLDDHAKNPANYGSFNSVRLTKGKGKPETVKLADMNLIGSIPFLNGKIDFYMLSEYRFKGSVFSWAFNVNGNNLVTRSGYKYDIEITYQGKKNLVNFETWINDQRAIEQAELSVKKTGKKLCEYYINPISYCFIATALNKLDFYIDKEMDTTLIEENDLPNAICPLEASDHFAVEMEFVGGDKEGRAILPEGTMIDCYREKGKLVLILEKA